VISRKTTIPRATQGDDDAANQNPSHKEWTSVEVGVDGGIGGGLCTRTGIGTSRSHLKRPSGCMRTDRAPGL
jgi:hypothetical protein